MKHLTKRIIAVLTILALNIGLLSACSVSDKLTLLDALDKTIKIKSLESNTNFKVYFGVSGIPQEILDQIGGMLPINDNIYMQLHQKQNQSLLGSVDSQTEGAITFGGTTMLGTLWAQNRPQGLRQIIQLPSQILNIFPPDLTNKKYLVMDQADLPQGEGINSELFQNTVQLQQKLIDFLKEYAMNYDPNFAVIQYIGEKNVRGENTKIYELKLTDASFKKLIRYSADMMTQNSELKALLKGLFEAFAGITAGTGQGESLENALGRFHYNSSDFDEDVNRLLDALDKVQMIGNRGISVALAINEAGYIVEQSGFADFIMNLQDLERAARRAAGAQQEELVSPDMVITLNTDFNTETWNINQEIPISFPELTQENSFRLEDLMGLIPLPGMTEE